nr:MAG TPA: hypothetical protein [Caudoviricetes sp.]
MLYSITNGDHEIIFLFAGSSTGDAGRIRDVRKEGELF